MFSEARRIGFSNGLTNQIDEVMCIFCMRLADKIPLDRAMRLRTWMR